MLTVFYLDPENANRNYRDGEQKRIVLVSPQSDGYAVEQFRGQGAGHIGIFSVLLFLLLGLLLLILGATGLILWFVFDVLAHIFT